MLKAIADAVYKIVDAAPFKAVRRAVSPGGRVESLFVRRTATDKAALAASIERRARRARKRYVDMQRCLGNNPCLAIDARLAALGRELAVIAGTPAHA